jgi:Kef-type K+ transport system membrane component KefB/mannitol/fructose-specific phosphotransferase system IIA component (Ntr-type)
MGVLSHHDVTILFVAIGLLLGTARILGEIAQRLGQPSVIGELLAGILLGPTVLGQLAPAFSATVFPTEGGAAIALRGITTVAIALFLLVAGLEIDLSTVWRQGRKATIVGLTGILAPFAIGFAGAWLAPDLLGAEAGADPLIFALFVATALSISALPVIAKTLMDLNLFRTDLGMITIAAAVFNDVVGWIVFALILAMLGLGEGGPGIEATIILTLAFTVLMLTAGRWLIHRVLPWIQANATWPGGVLGFGLTLALLAAAFTEWLGVHAIYGAFLVGIALGDSAHLRKQTRATIEQFISFIFAPLFFASIGLMVNFVAHFDFWLCLVVLVIATVGKLIGGRLGARLSGMSRREGWAVAVGLNARGTMEIILGLLALEAGLIGERLFVALVIMALATSIASGPALQRIVRRIRPARLIDYLDERGFIPQLAAGTRWEAIRELADAAAKVAGLDEQLVFAAVREREQLMPTGLANRLAVPNARIVGLRGPIVALGISRRGIDFDATDGQPAQIIALLLVPEDDDGAQWRLMADIAETFAPQRTREQVQRALGFTELRALLRLQEDDHDEAETTREGYILVSARPLARVWARRLIETGTPVWLIDTNRHHVEIAQREGIRAVGGNALRDVTLMQAHAFRARGLVALTPNRDTNVEIVRFASEEFAVPQLLAFGHHGTVADIHGIPLVARGELAWWDERLGRSHAVWDRIEVATAGHLDVGLRPDGQDDRAEFLPLVVERARGLGEPAWTGMPLSPGDVVHGLVASEGGDDVDRRITRLFERAVILDLDDESTDPVTDAESLFRRVAEPLAPRLHLGTQEIVERFVEREAAGGTVLTPELAVPHIAVDGHGIFEIVVVRARPGIVFASADTPVRAVFLLASSRDERALHLKVLAAIAGMAQRGLLGPVWDTLDDAETLRRHLVTAWRSRNDPLTEDAEG